MKILHIPIKRKWLEMIVDGEKLEEYRDIKNYWLIRLFGCKFDGLDKMYTYEYISNAICSALTNERFGIEPIKYDIVEFRAGYGKDVFMAQVEYKSVELKFGNKKWGAPNHLVFAIQLGEVLNVKNR